MKTVLISGASKGLGKDLALYFIKKDFRVISFSRNNLDIEIPKNWTHISEIDASNEENIDALTPYLSECDYLVNNVGMAYDGILATQGLDSIKTMVTTNLVSILYLTKLWLRERMKHRLAGNCVSISSIISERGFSGLSVYSATKGALNSMTRALAREMGPKNFRFNAVLPGYFTSDLSKNLSNEKKMQIIKRTPLGRLAEIPDILPLIDFLLSDNSAFITGQLIKVDGGLTV